MNFITTV